MCDYILLSDTFCNLGLCRKDLVWENIPLDSQSILISFAKYNISIGRCKRYLLRASIPVTARVCVMLYKSVVCGESAKYSLFWPVPKFFFFY